MRSIFAVIAATMFLTGCSAGAEKAAAETGVAQFRQRMASGRYQEIYSTAAQDFRQTSSEGNTLRFLEQVADRLGPVRRSTQQGWNVNFGTSGTLVTLGYATEFARGRGTENFVFRVSGGTPQLAGYHINSMDLMMASPPPQGDNKVVPITPVRR